MGCDVCGKYALYNYKTEDCGIKCKTHILTNMVNITSYEYVRDRFIRNIEKLGGTVYGEYKKMNVKIHCKCSKGHDCYPNPLCIQMGCGMCKICAGNDSGTSKKCFEETIIKLGAKIIGEYKNCQTPIECECSEGHKCNPRPSDTRRGVGICRVCAGNDPITAGNNFIKNIENLGGSVVGIYKMKDIPVECLCPNNHTCFPIPNCIRNGQGMCEHCKQSSGEQYISRILNKLDIKFEIETKNSLIKNKLRFDFKYEFNNQYYYLEFDGGQHFKYTPYIHDNEEDFKERQQKDLLKNYVAKLSNIKMIRIAYDQINRNADEFCEYLLKLMRKDDMLIIDSDKYNWMNNISLLDSTKEKYLVKI